LPDSPGGAAMAGEQPPEGRDSISDHRAIAIVIVARYASVRAGLAAILRDAEGIRVIGEVGGAADLADLLEEQAPDVVAVDIEEPELTRALGINRARE